METIKHGVMKYILLTLLYSAKPKQNNVNIMQEQHKLKEDRTTACSNK